MENRNANIKLKCFNFKVRIPFNTKFSQTWYILTVSEVNM